MNFIFLIFFYNNSIAVITLESKHHRESINFTTQKIYLMPHRDLTLL